MKILMKIITFLTIGTSFLNVLLPTDYYTIEKLLIFSLFLCVIYIWVTQLWINTVTYIYFVFIVGICYIEKNMVFVFLNFMMLIFFVLIFVYKANPFYIKMLILNIFLLSITFLIFKLFFLLECAALSHLLDFELDITTAKIGVEVNLSNSYIAYPANQFRTNLSYTGFQEIIPFFSHRLEYFPVELVFYFHWVYLFRDYLLPFIEITLVIS